MYQQNNHKRSDLTNLVIDEELIKLALREIITAQDINSPFYLC